MSHPATVSGHVVSTESQPTPDVGSSEGIQEITDYRLSFDCHIKLEVLIFRTEIYTFL